MKYLFIGTVVRINEGYERVYDVWMDECNIYRSFTSPPTLGV